MSEEKTRSAWLKLLPGILGGAWVIGAVGYRLWTSWPARTPLGNVLLSCVCVGLVASVVSMILPVPAQRELSASEVGNLWSFVRRSHPTDPSLRAQWHASRRSIAIMFATAVLGFVYVVATNLGITKP